MLDRLTSLEVFAKVAAIGSLSGAARSMGLSQTMVTKHVASLESRLGIKLFHRTTRQLSITEAGRSYLESSERILADMEAADAAVAAERVEPRGLLRVNVPVVFGTRQISPLLAEFAARYPKVTTELGLNDRLVDLAEEGWDLAIRIGKLRDSSMVARRLAPNRLVVCAAPAYLAAHGTPRTVADLSAHNCLGYTLSQQASAEEWLFGTEGEIRVQVKGNLRANNGDVLRAATLAGQGLARQPTFIIADDLRAGTLVALPLDQPEIQSSAVHAVYLPDRRPPAKVRAFIDFLAMRFAPEPPWDRGLF
ncbi:LysR family transcriptional regulator [Bradyrhizobium manausense]|uniref:LysR family transcriptional regulator n=1 Tax=Bradyrhizobium TaxID=374 RepID=UPI001BA587E1|nr:MULTISPECIES: LysR family transcriptional regulator [Bradyrhizobium]MBR0825833.1 LysR family transcriptional regulator [Bradyrhizobium manausense]UVO31227.1 LysR family transcriptional regulator [Bradyrhizobium arachidis]